MNLFDLTTEEAERTAYAAGDTKTAELFARIAELENQVITLENQIEDARLDSLEAWERNHGSAQGYWAFFHECFACLDGHYPCPEVSSDYDKSVIFNAIRKGEQ